MKNERAHYGDPFPTVRQAEEILRAQYPSTALSDEGRERLAETLANLDWLNDEARRIRGEFGVSVGEARKRGLFSRRGQDQSAEGSFHGTAIKPLTYEVSIFSDENFGLFLPSPESHVSYMEDAGKPIKLTIGSHIRQADGRLTGFDLKGYEDIHGVTIPLITYNLYGKYKAAYTFGLSPYSLNDSRVIQVYDKKSQRGSLMRLTRTEDQNVYIQHSVKPVVIPFIETTSS